MLRAISLRESWMREIRTSGLTRERAPNGPSLLYNSSSCSIFERCALSTLDCLSSHARLWRFLAPNWAQDFSLGRSPRNPQKSDQALQEKLCSPIGLFIACDVQRSRTRTSSRTRTIGNLPFLRLSLLTSHVGSPLSRTSLCSRLPWFSSH